MSDSLIVVVLIPIEYTQEYPNHYEIYKLWKLYFNFTVTFLKSWFNTIGLLVSFCLKNAHSLLLSMFKYLCYKHQFGLWDHSLMIVNEIRFRRYQFKIDFWSCIPYIAGSLVSNWLLIVTSHVASKKSAYIPLQFLKSLKSSI